MMLQRFFGARSSRTAKCTSSADCSARASGRPSACYADTEFASTTPHRTTSPKLSAIRCSNSDPSSDSPDLERPLAKRVGTSRGTSRLRLQKAGPLGQSDASRYVLDQTVEYVFKLREFGPGDSSTEPLVERPRSRAQTDEHLLTSIGWLHDVDLAVAAVAASGD